MFLKFRFFINAVIKKYRVVVPYTKSSFAKLDGRFDNGVVIIWTTSKVFTYNTQLAKKKYTTFFSLNSQITNA